MPMFHYGDVIAFLKVVETGTITRASELLGLPKSTVSRRLSSLESMLGVKLIYRNTRTTHLTDDGALFFDYCKRSIGILENGKRVIDHRKNQIQGLVKIVTTSVVGYTLISDLLAEFLEVYPHLRLVCVLSENPVEMFREGFDIAIDSGPLSDSGLIATKLGSTETSLFGSPFYFEKKGMPKNIVELNRYDLLDIGKINKHMKWHFKNGNEEQKLDIYPRMVCNDEIMLANVIVSGLGMGNLPAFIAKKYLAEGRLSVVLPQWKMEEKNFYAIFPEQSPMPNQIRVIIDFLVNRLRKKLSWDISPARETRVTG